MTPDEYFSPANLEAMRKRRRRRDAVEFIVGILLIYLICFAPVGFLTAFIYILSLP